MGGRKKGRQTRQKKLKKKNNNNQNKKDPKQINNDKTNDDKKSRKYKKEKPQNKEKVDKEVNAMLSSLGLASLPSKSDLDCLHCVYHEVANLVRDCAQNKLNE